MTSAFVSCLSNLYGHVDRSHRQQWRGLKNEDRESNQGTIMEENLEKDLTGRNDQTSGK